MTTWKLLHISFASLCVIGFTHGEEEINPGKYRPTYQFKYHVHDQMTMDYKTHEEVGENGLVRGSYTVREPNGDLRVVSYTAGDSGGFRAMVRVKPTLNPEADNSTYSDFNVTEGSNSPLKIQLSTEPKSDPPQQRDQRHSIREKIIATQGNKNNSSSIQLSAENLKSNKMLQRENLHTKLHFLNSDTSLGIKMPSVKNFKYTAYTTVLPPKQELTAAYVPIHLSSAQNTPQYGQLLGPLLLHVVPARFSRTPVVRFSPVSPKEQNFSERNSHKTKDILCSADLAHSNT